MNIDASALPSELISVPQPLIGFCGLDVANSSVHKSIWDAFSSNRKPERAAVSYKLLPPSYEFPAAKPKRTSYERYQPKGILKRNWMLKHLHVLPSVVVLFVDMEWNDSQWAEKQVQCATTIQTLRSALQERDTRLCLVLLQKAAPLPPGEDLLASERAASLTNACGLNSKMLFILPHTEHLMGFTLRLEQALLDMAQSYYAVLSKQIRTHRDPLTVVHSTLKIRHQFKLGFIAEIRQDFNNALKHYTQAYANLEEIRVTDVNCLEIKTIAGFLNYKICRLMFKLKVPREAINHFGSHIEKYRSRIGFKDLVFEHYAWLSSQHSVFAELFCEAIKNGLPALQTQHPGIYFHKAAEYIVKRKEAYLQTCAILLSPTETTGSLPNNNTMNLYTEYFGIRAVNTGDPAAEQQVNQLIRENEKSFNHSSAIINLLSQAMAQFKIYKCLRFRKKLAVDMAEEYFKSGDHSKALTLYSLMLPDYRQDKWTSLFSDVLLKTLRCALLSASVADYISCSIEAISLKIRGEKNERILVLENLWKVFQMMPPVSQSQIAPEVCDLWTETLTSIKPLIQIDLDKLIEVFELCATFEKIESKNDEKIKVYLFARTLTDVPVKVHGFSILITDGVGTFKLTTQKYMTFDNVQQIRDHHLNATESRRDYRNYGSDFKLEPNTYYQFLYTTDAQQFAENTQLRVTRIEIQMGTDKLSTVLTKSATYTRNAFRRYTRCTDLDDNLPINPFCYIAPTFHIATQLNPGNETMLVNEYHLVSITISNSYNVFVQGVGMSISVPNNLRNKVFLTTDVSPSRQKLHSQIQIDIGEMSMQTSNTVSFYVFSLIEADVIQLQQRTWYTVEMVRPKVSNSQAIVDVSTPGSAENSPENQRPLASDAQATLKLVSAVQSEFIDEHYLRKTREDTLSFKCELEFRFAGRLYTLHKHPLTKIYCGENFLFRANVKVCSSCDIDILETYFICDHNLVQSTYSVKRKKFTNTYRNGEKLEDVIVLRTNATLDNWVTMREFELNKLNPQDGVLGRLHTAHKLGMSQSDAQLSSGELSASTSLQLNKTLLSKIPTTMTIINNNNSSTVGGNSAMLSSQNSNMSSSTMSDEGKTTLQTSAGVDTEFSDQQSLSQTPKPVSTRLVFNKAMDGVLATGHCRGFIRAALSIDSTQIQMQQQQQQSQLQKQQPTFGVYCIKWRRSNHKEENESKFIVNGMEIENPPLNIYCSIEEKMFVKMPMTLKISLKNPTAKVLHLIATLNINCSDNFICSGHRQIDVSIFAFAEKELVYNLYPLSVGWQNLPQLTLEYNIQADPTKDEAQNSLLSELVQRSVPKKVFVLPPLKQQAK